MALRFSGNELHAKLSRMGVAVLGVWTDSERWSMGRYYYRSDPWIRITACILAYIETEHQLSHDGGSEICPAMLLA